MGNNRPIAKSKGRLIDYCKGRAKADKEVKHRKTKKLRELSGVLRIAKMTVWQGKSGFGLILAEVRTDYPGPFDVTAVRIEGLTLVYLKVSRLGEHE